MLQGIVGQVDAVDVPAALTVGRALALGVEILVVGFQEPVIIGMEDPVHRGEVRTEEDPVVILLHEPSGGVGLSAQLRNTGGNVDVHIGVLVQPDAHLLQILGIGAEVGDDEGGIGMLGQHILLHLHQLVEPVKPGICEAPVRMAAQFFVPLVFAVGGVEEGHGVGNVEQDGNVQPGRGFVDAVKPGIVGAQVVAVSVPVAKADGLPQLDALHGVIFHALFQGAADDGFKIWLFKAAHVHGAEIHEEIFEAFLLFHHPGPLFVGKAQVQIDGFVNPVISHSGDHFGGVVAAFVVLAQQELAPVGVHVKNGEFCHIDLGFLHFQKTAGHVIFQKHSIALP